MNTDLSDFFGLQVAIRSFHGTYFRAHPGGEGAGLDLQTQVGPWEKFSLEDQGNGKVAIKTAHGTFLRSHPGGEGAKVDLQTKVGPWEQYEITYSVGIWTIKSAHGTFLRSHPGGEGANVDLQTQVGPWEKYTFEVVSEALEVFDVVYALDHAKILATVPKSIASQTMTNNSELEQSMTVQINQTLTTKFSWSQKDGVKVGLKTTLKTGIPFLAEGKVEISAEYSHEWTSGSEESKSSSFTASLPMKVPAMSRQTARVTYHESNMEVPWKAKCSWKGTTAVKEIAGVWGGVSVHDVQATIDAAVKL